MGCASADGGVEGGAVSAGAPELVDAFAEDAAGYDGASRGGGGEGYRAEW